MHSYNSLACLVEMLMVTFVTLRFIFDMSCFVFTHHYSSGAARNYKES